MEGETQRGIRKEKDTTGCRERKRDGDRDGKREG